jgi:hypothetical protein
MDNECIDNFNKVVKYLVNSIDYENNDQLYRLRQRLFLLLQADETIVICHLGPIIWEHRVQILEHNIKELLAYTYKGTAKSSEESDVVNLIIQTIKKEYLKFSKDEQEDVYEKIKSLLIIYTKYLQLTKI